jgi:hypothetical protein
MAKKKKATKKTPKASPAQKQKVEKVMHEFKHGELRSGGSGDVVEDRDQAVAIALSEAGLSRNDSGKKKAAKKKATKKRAGKKQAAKKKSAE